MQKLPNTSAIPDEYPDNHWFDFYGTNTNVMKSYTLTNEISFLDCPAMRETLMALPKNIDFGHVSRLTLILRDYGIYIRETNEFCTETCRCDKYKLEVFLNILDNMSRPGKSK